MAWTRLLLASLAGLGIAQFPPKPEGVTTLKSKLHENVTLSFKEVSTFVHIRQLMISN